MSSKNSSKNSTEHVHEVLILLSKVEYTLFKKKKKKKKKKNSSDRHLLSSIWLAESTL